ncbi:MAG: metallopeptidase TldD-related protein [Acidobacteriota bacterium]
MPFADLDAAGIARVLSQLADQRGDLADAYFERSEEVELSAVGEPPGLRVRRESGLAIRLQRGQETWLAGRDRIDAENFGDAVRRVARALPSAPYAQPDLDTAPWREPFDTEEVLAFPDLLRRALSALGTEDLAREVKISVRRHRRWLRVIGLQVSSGVERESFYSVTALGRSSRRGALYPLLDESAAEALARGLARDRFAEDAPPPKGRAAACVLGAGAAAVLLHEAVAHALEADILARGGHPEAAIGVELGSPLLNVFDDPQSAPESVRRRADDEGYPTLRRCLLRAGKVEQPICDASWSRRSDLLMPGGGRRGDRQDQPGPRSLHLELVAGDQATHQLFADADGGLYFPEADRGHLDPDSGHFVLGFPYGLRIENGTPGSAVGPCSISGHVSEVLGKIDGLGREAKPAGAGWCAKGAVRLPVWSTAPALRLSEVEVDPR